MGNLLTQPKTCRIKVALRNRVDYTRLVVNQSIQQVMNQPRSECPINFSLEVIGDPWSLLVVRDIVFFGKNTYNDFAASEEGIARNILAERLDRLQQVGILKAVPHPEDGRKKVYQLTERGLDLIPVLSDLIEWGARHAPTTNAAVWWLDAVRKDRKGVIKLTRRAAQHGETLFASERKIRQVGMHNKNKENL